MGRRFRIKFQNEPGMDCGGLLREWFTLLTEKMLSPDYGLFEDPRGDLQAFQPNKYAAQVAGPDWRQDLELSGRVVAKALTSRVPVGVALTPACLKTVAAEDVHWSDFMIAQPDLARNLRFLLEWNDFPEDEYDFVVEEEVLGELKRVELIPNGSEVPVTKENRVEYVRAVMKHKMIGSADGPMAAFAKGFHSHVPRRFVEALSSQELQTVLTGPSIIDIEDWKLHCTYPGQPTERIKGWWWDVIESLSQEERRQLLQFATGSNRVALGGFVNLRPKFQVYIGGGPTGWPTASTCSNQINIPLYKSYADMKNAFDGLLRVAKDAAFGFA
eukprot:NODE_1529_length_1137_cov_56.423713_g1244_i0.p1 GENE.NODE_1529_length_1137_cov_56.423713_g1244_i0~~NODE_1529_length_1137_cov_56.423713_g1244_i0.p1  ORF type:complete len:329 (-),score=106.16 NODE_1529_length_1137_cov_56.423713_g1244_i0:120-1106(-)